ncbi:MAG: formate dehydrogenase subunit alpha [Gracilibacteraceae bacterium]|jgi:formate dehydrogenase alpha subunit|nr:formate dehydrogenase subunit alpha [Gracilibacteraceae bacterium]
MNRIQLIINGATYNVPAGTTLLGACRMHKIEVPTLCFEPSLRSWGACRLCVVEVEGRRSLAASCGTEAAPGMVVLTDSPRVREARKTLLELLVANHDIDCLTCEKMGRCELARYAYEYGVKKDVFQGEKRRCEIDDTNPFITRDMNKCILCGRCVRACADIQAQHVLHYAGRGFESRVTPAFDLPYGESDCVFCGSCLSVCPVGALTEKKMAGRGRPWEITKVRTTCPFCGTGCGFDLNVKNGRVIGVTSAANAPVNGRSLCVKGRFGTDLIHSPQRLTRPLIRRDGVLQEAEWHEAFDLIAARLKAIRDGHGPDALAALSSARCTNEENFLMQKFVRVVLGTNNVDHCARVCHAASVIGLRTPFGSGAMTNSIREIPSTKTMLVIGANPTEAHPVIGSKMKQAAQNGCRIIVADPRRIELVRYAELWLRLKPGTDTALINGIMHVILAEGWEDRRFIEERTSGFANLREVVREYTPEYVSAITDVPAADVRRAAEIYARGGGPAQIFYTLGIAEHTCGTDNVMALANLAMLTGNVGKENSGVNPLRGQNNVQGGCDMGALPDCFPGYQKVTDLEIRRKFEKSWGISLSPQEGLMLPQMLDACVAGQVKGMYIMGEDPLSTDADSSHVRAALTALDFLVVQDIFLTETAKLADVVLPGASFAEKSGTFTNTERRVQMVRQAIEPLSGKADWRIICELAGWMGYDFSYASPAEVMTEIAALTPQYTGISHSRLGTKGLQWPVPAVDHYGTPILHRGRFTRGRGLFMPVEYREAAELPDAEYPLMLTTGRKLAHYNISTAYSPALMEHDPEEFAEISPEDARRLRISDGEIARVTTRRGTVRTKVRVTERVRPGIIFMTFHYKAVPVNVLTNGAWDKVSGTYEYKVCAARLEKIRG